MTKAEAALRAGGTSQAQIDAIGQEIAAAIDAAVEAAQRAPLPSVDDLWTDVRV